MRHAWIICFITLLVSAPLRAEEPIASKPEQIPGIGEYRPEQGWFFYEKEKEKKKQKTKTEKTPAPAPEPTPEPAPLAKTPAPEKKPMTVAWMRKMIPILEERALDDPTPENVAAYAYLVRTLGDKAQRYTTVHMELIKADPFLDMNNSMPISGNERQEILNEAAAQKRKAIKIISKNVAGLFVFFDSKCSYCRTQIKVVNDFAKENHFDVMFVSVDGKGLPGASGWVKDNGTAKMLGVNIYPSTFLAIPPKTYVPISYGLMTKDELENSLFMASKAAKIIPEDLIESTDPFNKGVLTLDDMKDGAYDDPKDFVKYIREKLKRRY